MDKKLYGKIQKSPQSVQTQSMHGLYRGIVVDVQDPAQNGRVRVYSYPLHGDMAGVCINDLPWCDFIQPLRGSFTPPQKDDRVIISFECGDKYAPMVIGYWNAIPMGRGEMPYSSKVGSEIRPEAWHHHGLYPEATILASSGAGNVFWFEDKQLGDNLASAINMEDTGGKLLRARSFHLGYKGYTDKFEYDGKRGGLLEGGDPPEPLRKGTEPAPPAAGVIELANHNIQRSLRTSEESFSADQMLQANDDGDIGVAQESVSGQIHRSRQGIAALNMSSDVMSLMGRAITAMPFYTPPRIW